MSSATASVMHTLKRNGKLEPIDMTKANKVLEWACEGISGTSPSDLAMEALPKIYDGIPSVEIHKSFIQAAEDLISQDYHYAEVQSRLLIVDLLKRVYGDWDIIKPLSEVVKENSALGIYDPELYSAYTEIEWKKFDTMIDHKRDYRLMGAGLKQMRDKYLAQDRSTGQIFETPQVVYALAAIAGLKNYKKNEPAARMRQIKKTYEAFSKGEVSLPTPVLAGVRQKIKQYSSCVLIDVGDDLPSINDACTAANKYASKRAGLGINMGRIRPVKSKIGNGEVVHTGIVPFIRQMEGAIKSCSQGGIRDASATIYVPIWHYEIEDILILKSPKTTHDKAVRRLDYCAQWDSFLMKKAMKGEDLYLFSPHEVPDLYEAFFGKDRQVFNDLYEKYSKDESLKFRKAVNGRYIANSLFLTQASETGRIYQMNVDHVNTHSPFKEPIYMSNLCVEITLPTKPIRNVCYDLDKENLTSITRHEGLVQLCTLGAINLGTIDLENTRDMENRMEIMVIYLNELLDTQEYVIPQSYKATMEYRPLGIGVINYAYFLAKRGLKYNDQGSFDITHILAEQMYYYALKASMNYAKYKGQKVPCWEKLIYSDGKTLLDTYCKNVDELTSEKPRLDWDTLKKEIAVNGLYNSTLLALMPSESSSVVLNATSGIEPIRSLITSKANKKISFKQVAPENHKLKNAYDYLWDMTPDHFEGYIKNAAIWQKFICQSISVNFSYNPDHFKNGKVEMTTLMKHSLMLCKYGNKTRYYLNTKGEDENKLENMMAQEEKNPSITEGDDSEGGCAGGACKI